MIPFDLNSWIEDNRHLLKPPVGNKCVFKDEHLIVMMVGGPNDRSDFHVNETSEFFYQIEGLLELDVQADGDLVTHIIDAGKVFLLPANVPHRPRRLENSVGLVVELVRNEKQLDGLEWYCEKCNHLLFSKRFPLTNIELDFKAVFDTYFSDRLNGKCNACNHHNF
ncbi:MAG: 3-hydroxyanthranilate 3,4-dioxygenase [Sphingobacteriales bacterium]|jgi:3-hydroxyanthranilate 3,4-dioxygenase